MYNQQIYIGQEPHVMKCFNARLLVDLKPIQV